MVRLASTVSVLCLVMASPATSMKCIVDSKGLKAEFHKIAGANYYEVQIATAAKVPFAAEASEGKGGYVHIYGALPGTTYYVRLRSHSSSKGFRLRNGWSAPGSWYKCHYPKSSYNRTDNVGEEKYDASWPHLPRSKKASTFNLGAVRSRCAGTFPAGQPFPDYLDDKNAADYRFATPWSQNGGVVTLYCVEILKRNFDKSQIFTYDTSGHVHYANYMSCDLHNNDPSTGKPWSPDYVCTPISDGDCKDLRPKISQAQCDAAQKHPGRLHVGRGTNDQQDEYVYSFPRKAECREHEDVGTKRKDGTICTWRRMNHVRFTQNSGQMSPQQLEAALHNVPLKPWQCAHLAQGEASHIVDIIV